VNVAVAVKGSLLLALVFAGGVASGVLYEGAASDPIMSFPRQLTMCSTV